MAVATQAGRTADEDFPGGGYVFGPSGACIAESGDWSEGMLLANVEPHPDTCLSRTLSS